jgi:hypothetical protein
LGSGYYYYSQHSKGEEGFSQATYRQAQEVIKKQLRDPESARMRAIGMGPSERLTSWGKMVANPIPEAAKASAEIRQHREEMRNSPDPILQKMYHEEIARDYVQCLWIAVNAKNAFGGYAREELWCVEIDWLTGDVVRAQPDTPRDGNIK